MSNKVTLSTTEHEGAVAYLKSRLWTDGWKVRDDQLDALVGVLPAAGTPDATMLAGPEAAFVIGESLLLAHWTDAYKKLHTDVVHLPGLALSIDWNAHWLGDLDAREAEDVPEERPLTVTLEGPDGTGHTLPFDAAWENPAGCIHFATTVIARAHGFRPGIVKGNEADRGTWKR